MSKMADVMIEIEELYMAGYTAMEIFNMKAYPMSWIEEVINTIDGIDESGYYDESMDGDTASALASAGWGTDEDYGGSLDDPF